MLADPHAIVDDGRVPRTATVDGASSSRSSVAALLTWISLLGGWLVLGALGTATMPLQAGGLAAIALWLAAAGFTRQTVRVAGPGAARSRLGVLASSLVALGALESAIDGGGSPALLLAASAWGVSLGASCNLLPARATVDRSGAARSRWPAREAAGWLAWSARWSMLPMMATLVAMAGWCGDAWGLSASASIGLHLAAMLLPALVVRPLRNDAWTDRWIAIAMMAGVVATFALPLLQALTMASLCQSVACSLAWSSRRSRPSDRPPAAGLRPWLVAGLPAACVWILGSAIADRGPLALLDVQRTLGLFAVACLVAAAGSAAFAPARVRS